MRHISIILVAWLLITPCLSAADEAKPQIEIGTNQVECLIFLSANTDPLIFGLSGVTNELLQPAAYLAYNLLIETQRNLREVCSVLIDSDIVIDPAYLIKIWTRQDSTEDSPLIEAEQVIETIDFRRKPDSVFQFLSDVCDIFKHKTGTNTAFYLEANALSMFLARERVVIEDECLVLKLRPIPHDARAKFDDFTRNALFWTMTLRDWKGGAIVSEVEHMNLEELTELWGRLLPANKDPGVTSVRIHPSYAFMSVTIRSNMIRSNSNEIAHLFGWLKIYAAERSVNERNQVPTNDK